jgi:hypothetical protein
MLDAAGGEGVAELDGVIQRVVFNRLLSGAGTIYIAQKSRPLLGMLVSVNRNFYDVPNTVS